MTIVVDGRTIEAHEGELLLDALRRAGHAVPTLCHDDVLEPYGGCRLCLVDVEGSTRPVPACATRVEEGMVMSTNGRTTALRTTLTEMLLSEHESAAGGRPDELAALADGIAPPTAAWRIVRFSPCGVFDTRLIVPPTEPEPLNTELAPL